MNTPHPKERPVIDPASVEAKAKAIMDAFLKEMQGVDVPADFGLRRDEQTREPKQEACDPRFQSNVFANAPNVKDDEFVMERKQW